MVSKAYNGFPAAYRDKQARMVYGGFRTGKFTRPLKCVMCGLHDFDGALIHAHNEDYHNPLNFVGLCFCCHMAVHKRFNYLATWYAYRKAVSLGWKPPKVRDYRVFIKVWESFSVEREGVPDTTGWAWQLPDVEPNLYEWN